ncbi:MAG: universal stress protein [Gemmatimonadales bacterium]
MFRSLLVTTDFSANSAVAMRPALAIAEKFGARIVLIHVLEAPSTDPSHPGKAALKGLAEMAQEQLEEFGGREIGSRVPWAPEVASGPAAQAITDAARRHAADLIVVATHGRTGVLHLLLGSVAERVVRTAACPVLTVRVGG